MGRINWTNKYHTAVEIPHDTRQTRNEMLQRITTQTSLHPNCVWKRNRNSAYTHDASHQCVLSILHRPHVFFVTVVSHPYPTDVEHHATIYHVTNAQPHSALLHATIHHAHDTTFFYHKCWIYADKIKWRRPC